MAFKVDIPEKYKPEFPFLDDSQAMEKLSFESFKETVDDHIKKLHKNEGTAGLLAFRNEYQKRLEFVRSQLQKTSSNKRQLENSDLCYSFCVERSYYWLNHFRELQDGRTKYTKHMKNEAKKFYQENKDEANNMAAKTWVENKLIPHLAVKFNKNESFFNESTFRRDVLKLTS
jgi:hypothetical protein